MRKKHAKNWAKQRKGKSKKILLVLAERGKARILLVLAERGKAQSFLNTLNINKIPTRKILRNN
jgi:hypothetical protein